MLRRTINLRGHLCSWKISPLKLSAAVEGLLARATAMLRVRLSENGRLSAAKIEAEQHAAHGLAWLATYVEAIKELAGY